MEFSKYNSIENSYRQKFIDMITIDPELMNQTWYAHEKIHGANFSIYGYFDGDATIVQYAKRSGFISNDEKFYGLNNHRDDFKHYAFDLAKVLDMPETEFVIRGELYGGGYNHPDVPNEPDSRVQKGTEYNNVNSFMAFDLEVNNEIIDWDVAEDVFRRSGIPTVPLMIKGTFQECIEYNNTFNSVVPAYHGLPDIGENIAEGTVVKPNQAKHFNSGSRVILKNKTEKFCEKAKTKKSKVFLFTPEMDEAVVNISQYINENRLRNVLSHFGEIKQKDFGKITGLMCQDVILDYLKEYSPLPDKSDWKKVTKQTSFTCAMLIREHWLNILDENY